MYKLCSSAMQRLEFLHKSQIIHLQMGNAVLSENKDKLRKHLLYPLSV